MSRRRICIVNWRDIRNPEAGGAEVYFHTLFSHIAARGTYDVTVLSHTFKGAAQREDIDGLHVIRRGSRSLFNFAAALWLFRHGRDYDCIIEDINKVPFFTPLYIRKPRLHMVMHFFGSAIFSEINAVMASYIYMMERAMALAYRRERFVAISESTRRDIYRLCGDHAKVSVVEPGIDTDFFYSRGNKAQLLQMVYIGRLKRYKNVQFVLRCLPRLCRDFPGLEFHVAGGGDYAQELKRIAQSLGVSRHVVFHGFVSEDEKCRLLSEASVNVLPSIKEGWGITNIEANCCGTVTLASDVHGCRDSVQHGSTGYLFMYNDKDDFVKKAIELLSDTDGVRTRMEQKVRQFGARFAWPRMARKMEQVLDRLFPA